MDCGRKTFKSSPRNRRGLSFVEFVGCLLAMGGGIALGSVYLGVDMKTLFVGILEKSELVEPGFFASEAAAEETIAIYPEEADKAAAKPVADFSGDAIQDDLIRESTKEEQQAATQLYWQGLTACIREELSRRSMASGGANKLRLFDYLTRRREGHQKAVKVIEAFDRRHVDQRLLWHGDQVLAWHQAGERLYSQAVDLLTDSPSDQLTGPLAENWQSGATQHRMEERLVRDKHFSVAGYLDHEFKNAAPFKPAF